MNDTNYTKGNINEWLERKCVCKDNKNNVTAQHGDGTLYKTILIGHTRV